MPGQQNHTPLKRQPDPQRYLTDHLWERWQAGDVAAGVSHLQAVLRAVLTYLPRHVVQAQLADPSTPAVSGSFVKATLMFADISGFTAMSERLSQLGREGAEVITGIVNDYFEAMLAIIAQRGGDLFKFGGDALLVCFKGEGAADRACAAALEMQEAMGRFAVIETDQGTFNLRMKVGLGTGTLLLANLGTPERLEFAVMGPALSRMAKAESTARAGETLMDRATRDAAGPRILVDERSSGLFRIIQTKVPIEGPPGLEAFEPHAFEELGLLPASAAAPGDARGLIQRLDAVTPFIPPLVLERIVSSPGQRMIEGEHRLVTVLFANFYGFNDILAQSGADRAHEITTFLNGHFTAMQRVIRKYGGIVNKVDTYAVGYRIMALFGAPIAHEDDPARAVHAALEMQEALADFNRLERAGGGTQVGRSVLRQRIGINTGYVFAGNLGSIRRREYSVMGDEVNLAARLMGIAEEGQVLISQSTAQHVKGMFLLQPRQPVQVKGKGRSVRSYRVLRGLTRRGVQMLARGAFIGRQEELRTALELLDAALAGRGVTLDVSGDAGVGKSRLVAELCASAGERGIETLRGEAVSYGRGVPYLPWTAVLRALFGFQEGQTEAAERRREKLIAALDAAGLSMWSPMVGSVLGIHIPETALTAALDAKMRQQRFFDVVLQLIQHRARRSPLLLVLDDMQWADAVSLDLATYAARNAPASSLLFVIIHRTDLEAPPWSALPACQTLFLGEMEDEDILSLARTALGQGDLSEPLRRLILDRAQGNPLFVEEVASALTESAAITLQRPEPGTAAEAARAGGTEQGDPVWVLGDAAADLDVPTTLTGLIMSRIDRLATTNRRLLRVASVIGVDFHAAMLARVYPYGDLNGALRRWLDELVRLNLMTFVPPDAYAFKHTLTQEVAYNSLSFNWRRQLHVRVGEDIEWHHVGDLAEHYGVLARHFDQGRVFEKAFTYLVSAGDKAHAEFANQVALEHYARALEVVAEVEPDATRFQARIPDILQAMGDVYQVVGRCPEAAARFHEAIAHPGCSPRRRADLLRKIAKAHELQGQYDQALDFLAQARHTLSSQDQDRQSAEMARICDLSGLVHTRRGEMDSAVQDCEQGLAIVAMLGQAADALGIEADLYTTLGAIYVELQGNYDAAARAYLRSTDLRQQAGDSPGLARSYNNLARVAWGQGDLVAAEEYLRRVLDISQQMGNNYALAFGYNNLGVISYTTGDVQQAIDHYRTALSLRQRIGDNYGVGQTCYNLGEAYLSLDRHDEARRYLEQAVSVFAAIQSERELPEVYCLLAEVALVRDDVASALDYAGSGRRIAASIGSTELQGIAARVLARAQAQGGDFSLATQSFAASIVFLTESGHQVELARSHYEFGSLLAHQSGQRAPAWEHLQRATELFAAAGAEREAAQARAALAQLEA